MALPEYTLQQLASRNGQDRDEIAIRLGRRDWIRREQDDDADYQNMQPDGRGQSERPVPIVEQLYRHCSPACAGDAMIDPLRRSDEG